MKILVVNAIYGTGSTGRIAARLAREESADAEAEIVFAYGRADYVPKELRDGAWRIGTRLEIFLHGLLTRLFDMHGTGLCSWWATRRFLKRAERFDPDILWLHNLHGYYLNYELLFKWIKSRPQMKVKWMLHDCWAFTGHCSHYTSTGCSQYKTDCARCPQRGDYPASKLFSRARRNLAAKKRAFLGCPSLTLVISSKWLAKQVESGFLGGRYPVEMRPYELNREMFRPTPGPVRQRLGLQGKVMVLGVASQWDDKKGFPDMLELARLMAPDWRIVLVGLEPRQLNALPANVIGIVRTHDQRELAELYSAADWFFNPTHEDIYSMTNMEAAACGCRIVSYDAGGAPEAVEGYDKAILLSEHTAQRAWETMKNENIAHDSFV